MANQVGISINIMDGPFNICTSIPFNNENTTIRLTMPYLSMHTQHILSLCLICTWSIGINHSSECVHLEAIIYE